MTTEQPPEVFEPSGDPLLDEVRLSRMVTQNTGKAVNRLADRVKWSRIREFVLGAVVALSLLALTVGGLNLLQVRQQNRQIAEQNRCLAIFAAATADRTGALAPANAKRQVAEADRANAEAALILSIIPTPGQTEAQQRAAFQQRLIVFKDTQTRFAAADREYQATLAEHPPPTPPEDTC